MNNPGTPTNIVILGGTGDLARRKLLHALLDLYARQKLPDTVSIVGAARQELETESYRSFVKEALGEHEHEHSEETIDNFCSKLHYVQGSIDDPDFYTRLGNTIDCVNCNRLFYLAVPPALYAKIFQLLHDSGVAKESNDTFARVLVEKPFGKDLATAQALDQQLSGLFTESQIFRIDHYLAKEAVQNILSFRFANTLFRSPWNREHITKVIITMHETIDVGKRVSFYEGVGALRDVGQNHLLQLLALIAMEEPATLEAGAIRKNRAAVLEALTPESKETIATNVKRAQYNGYRESEGAEQNSATETYFELTAYIDNDRWQGVPFFVTAGKGLAEAKVSIEVHFNDVATGPFETSGCETRENVITLDISPEQAMSITLNAKAAGLNYALESRTLSFVCDKGEEEIKNSYEKVLLDCLNGDQTLFTTTEEVIAAWRYITSILENWDDTPLTTYDRGTLPEFN